MKEYSKPKPAKMDRERKTRKCLVCRRTFESDWSGNRVCQKCKATSAWKSGALG